MTYGEKEEGMKVENDTSLGIAHSYSSILLPKISRRKGNYKVQ